MNVRNMDREGRGENFSSQNDNRRVLSIAFKESAWDMYKVTCSGGFFFVPRRVCEEMGLREGISLSEEMLRSLELHHLHYCGYRKSLDLLSRRAHSEGMLRLKLRQRRYPDEIIDGIISRLLSEGLINDREFGELYLNVLLRKQKYGRGMLLAKLRDKGLSRELSENLLITVTDTALDEALEENAEKLYKKSKMTEEKMVRSLIGKGFTPSKVYECARKYFNVKKE